MSNAYEFYFAYARARLRLSCGRTADRPPAEPTARKAVAVMRNFSPEELGEIRTIYRQAANPTAQIGILAQLYACTTNDIRNVLRLAPLPPKTKTLLQWTEEMTDRLLVLADGRYTVGEIADDLGIARQQVASRAQRLRKQGYILLFSGSPAIPRDKCAQKEGGSA